MRVFLNKENSLLNLEQNTIIIKDRDEVMHISKSLRMSAGDELELCVPSECVYLCEISEILKNEIIFRINDKKPLTGELRAEIDLYQGVVKSTKWEIIIQKCVEFGINSITPVDTIRSVSKFDDERGDKKLLRWQKIADEAAKQCYRGKLPAVHPSIKFSEMLAKMKIYDTIIIAYEGERDNTIKHLSDKIMNSKKIAIFIGAEGGIDKSEIDALASIENVHIVSLGDRILRCESAGFYLLAQLGLILS